MRTLICLFLLILVSACSNTHIIDASEIEGDQESKFSEAEALSLESYSTKLEVVDDFYMLGKTIEYDKNRAMLGASITVRGSSPVELEVAASRLKSIGLDYVIVENCTSKTDSVSGSKKVRAPRYSGTVKGYLKYLEDLYDYHPSVLNNIVTFNRCSVETMTFPNSVYGSSASFKVSAITDAQVSAESSVSKWEDFLADIQSQLTPEGRLINSDRVGIVTISDRPKNFERIRKHLANLSTLMKKQVSLTVKLIQYNSYKSNFFDASGSVKFGGSKFESELTSPALSGAGAGSISGSIISGKFADSSIVLASLNKDESIAITSSTSLVAMNGMAVPFNISNSQNYIKSITKEVDKDTNIESRSYEIDVINTGIDVVFVPIVDSGGAINLTMYIKQKDLVKIDKIEDIQLPQTSENSSFQTMRIYSGDTLILTGFEESRKSNLDQSVIPGTIIAGGGNSKGLDTRKMAIVIVPELL